MFEALFQCVEPVRDAPRTNDRPFVWELRSPSSEKPTDAGHATVAALPGTAGASNSTLTDTCRFVWSLPQGPCHDPTLATLSVRVVCLPRTERVSVYSTADAIPTRDLRRRANINGQLLRDTQAYLRSRASRLLSNDPLCKAWQQFYTHYHSLVCRIVRASRIPQAEWDDCVQEIWLAIIRKLNSLDLESRHIDFGSWLSTLTHWKVVDCIRRMSRRRTTNLLSSASLECHRDADLMEACEKQRQLQVVGHALGRLRRRARNLDYEVLWLRSIEGFSVSQVAARLGLSSRQVWNRHYRGKRKLQKLVMAEERKREERRPRGDNGQCARIWKFPQEVTRNA